MVSRLLLASIRLPHGADLYVSFVRRRFAFAKEQDSRELGSPSLCPLLPLAFSYRQRLRVISYQQPLIFFSSFFSSPSVFPDEFDQLSASFAPWLKLSPRDRRDRLRDAETMRDGEYEEVSGKQSLVRVISDGMGGLGVSL